MDERQKQLIIDYQYVFESDAGRRVAADLEENFDPPTVKLSIGNSDETAFWLGQRSVVLYIAGQIKENLNRQRQEVAESEAEDAAD